ncbi:IS630 transposase-related protein, partial [Neisseria sp.]|uniref:IS630 transposase-related protein n=1 Tax=Neisseria sp. TaxID=192066 RepID=UPI00289D5087
VKGGRFAERQKNSASPSPPSRFGHPPASQVPPKQRKTRKISAQALLEDVERYPDAYCYERAQRFGCSSTAIHKALKRYNISYKKRPPATRKPTEGSEKTS